MSKDFRASQLETSKLILSGGIGLNGLGGIIYSGSVATNREGGIPASMLSNVGTDTMLFISGTIGGKGTSGILLVGGDLHVSGNLTVDGTSPGGGAGADYDWVDRNNQIVTTSSVSIAGGLGDTFKASDADSLAYVFISGSRTEIGTVSAGSTGLSAGTQTNAFFGGDTVFSGSLYGRSLLPTGEKSFDFSSDNVYFRKSGQFSIGDASGNAPSVVPNNDPEVIFSVSGSIGARGKGVAGVSLFGGDLLISGSTVTRHSFMNKVTTHNANYSVDSSMHQMLISPNTALTASLQSPSDAGLGRILVFKDVAGSASGSNIVITGYPIDGASSVKIMTNYGSVTLISNGSTSYHIIGVS